MRTNCTMSVSEFTARSIVAKRRVRSAESEVDDADIAAAHAAYEAERDTAIGPDHVGPRPSGGVGGTLRGVKCLHAHVAHLLAGNEDAVGRWTLSRLGDDRSVLDGFQPPAPDVSFVDEPIDGEAPS